MGALASRRSPSPTSFARPIEIAEVLEVPVVALLDPRPRTKSLPGAPRPILFYHYAPVIWCATARMLAELLDAVMRRSTRRR